MERLAEGEASLFELLRQLSVPTSVGTAPVSEVSVADARQTADEAAAALRGLAARIQAIERGRNAAPARERAALDAAVAKLREQLDDGLEGYGGLVAAALPHGRRRGRRPDHVQTGPHRRHGPPGRPGHGPPRTLLTPQAPQPT